MQTEPGFGWPGIVLARQDAGPGDSTSSYGDWFTRGLVLRSQDDEWTIVRPTIVGDVSGDPELPSNLGYCSEPSPLSPRPWRKTSNGLADWSS